MVVAVVEAAMMKPIPQMAWVVLGVEEVKVKTKVQQNHYPSKPIH